MCTIDRNLRCASAVFALAVAPWLALHGWLPLADSGHIFWCSLSAHQQHAWGIVLGRLGVIHHVNYPHCVACCLEVLRACLPAVVFMQGCRSLQGCCKTHKVQGSSTWDRRVANSQPCFNRLDQTALGFVFDGGRNAWCNERVLPFKEVLVQLLWLCCPAVSGAVQRSQ
ncbi:hypothetical protein COO60DRAFT_715499 [Scenedesmus sp. NREL 46B-D3]|nr:hypothetical protein COO60DRAFT_715499 [Scenedesmus sp. NREL 46B-D3]